MKFPSLFKTPRHSRFNYDPRYYDPIKEEIQKKIEAARKAKAAEQSDADYSTSSISEAFRRRERKSSQASTLQLIIAILLMGTFIGWMFYGNKIFYAFILLSPLYFYFRFRGLKKKQE